MDANDFERRYLGLHECLSLRQMLAAKVVNRYSNESTRWAKCLRLHTIWVDGGFDGEPFMRWVMDVCR